MQGGVISALGINDWGVTHASDTGHTIAAGYVCSLRSNTVDETKLAADFEPVLF